MNEIPFKKIFTLKKVPRKPKKKKPSLPLNPREEVVFLEVFRKIA